jgi:hypothetical protein
VTARWPRLISIAVINVTTFPKGRAIFPIAMFVLSQNVMVAWILYIAPSAAMSSATSAKISSIAPNVERLSAASAKITSTATHAKRHAASIAKIGYLARNAKIHSVLNARKCSSVTSATSRSVSTAKIRRLPRFVLLSTAKIRSAVASAKSHSALSTATMISTVKCAKIISALSAKNPTFRARNASSTFALIA